MEITVFELPVEVQNGLEDCMLLFQHFCSGFPATKHLTEEVVDPFDYLTILGLRCLEDGQKSLRVIKDILLQEEALSRRLDRQIDEASHGLEDHVLPVKALFFHVFLEVFDYLRDDTAHVVGEVQPQLLLSAEVADETVEGASDRQSVRLLIFEKLQQL